MKTPAPRTFALVQSPLLAPSAWRAVGEALGRSGEAARLVDLRGALEADGDVYGALGAAAAEQIVGGSIIVAHSGGGAIVPSILQFTAGRVRAVIFVDALLPHPSRSWMETAPKDLAQRLRAAARHGRAPPWPTWLPKAVLAKLLPDEAMRQELVACAPAAPLAFLDAPAPEAPRWATSCAMAYLQLSTGYESEASQAADLGWPVDRFDGHHLSMMTEPAATARAIVALADEMILG